MKIKAYQSGGITYIPTENRLLGDNSGAQQSAPGNASIMPKLSKELWDLLKESGLNSDVSVFLNKAESILTNAYKTGEPTVRDITRMARYASRVKDNNKYYEKAYTSLDTENAWGEMATDIRGNLYVYREDNTGRV